MDAATTSLVALVVSTIGTVALAWIGFKIKKLEHHINGVRTELVKATAEASHAAGKVAGRAEHQAEATLTTPRPSQG
jgi:hypothetical protein